MYDQTDVRELIGSDLYASDDKVGRIGQIYLDDETGRPEWATVNTGFFGTSESFVPLADASRAEGGLAVSYSKSQIKDAPNVEPDNGHLSEDEEARLYRHYGLQYSERRSDSGLPEGDAGTAAGTTTDESLVRREEELNVGKEKVQAGRARLRKFVVTEDQTVTVPVRKEKVRLEREPLTDEDRAAGAGTIAEGETDVTLSEERVTVDKETVAKEKVGLRKEVEESEETVSDQVRKEQVDVEGDVDRS